MCGRLTQKSPPENVVEGPFTPRYNGAPGQEHWVIRQNHETGNRHFGPLLWGLIPFQTKEANGGLRPINARAESIAAQPMFRDGYRRRRCLVPIDSFFEWKSAAGHRQPFAVGMKDGSPFALAGIWENWKKPGTDVWVRTFAILTTRANALIADIHDRMPVIIPPNAYDRWLSQIEPDPRDLLVPYTADAMTFWSVGMAVNKPQNDDPSILALDETEQGALL